MHFVFSKRSLARQAAISAHNNYTKLCAERCANGLPSIDYWSYVIDAALAAIPAPGANHEKTMEKG